MNLGPIFSPLRYDSWLRSSGLSHLSYLSLSLTLLLGLFSVSWFWVVVFEVPSRISSFPTTSSREGHTG